MCVLRIPAAVPVSMGKCCAMLEGSASSTNVGDIECTKQVSSYIYSVVCPIRRPPIQLGNRPAPLTDVNITIL